MREKRGSDTNSGKTDHRLILEPDLPLPTPLVYDSIDGSLYILQSKDKDVKS